MPTPKKLAVFDIDGTIANGGVLDNTALAGIAHLQKQGYITTLSTGRGYQMVRHLLGEKFDQVVSSDALLILEHGTKITNTQGEVFFAEYFEPSTVTHITDFMRANIEIINRAWTSPENPHEKVLVWCKDSQTLELEFDRKRDFTDVFTGPIGLLKEKLLAKKLCHVGVALVPHVRVENLKLLLTRSPISILFLDGNADFIRTNINKGLAILYCMRQLGIDYGDVLVAGNAINDVEMLNLSVGKRILVGPRSDRATIRGYLAEHESLTEVDTPEALGHLLLELRA